MSTHLSPYIGLSLLVMYLVRAFVATHGYLQLTADQAIYPVYNVSGRLTSDQSYTVTFSKKPPVTGFWSLTVYDDEAYLVPNEWNVYALGDRSAIEYPDGSLVYPTSGSSDTDEEFILLLQTKDTPPAEKSKHVHSYLCVRVSDVPSAGYQQLQAARDSILTVSDS